MSSDTESVDRPPLDGQPPEPLDGGPLDGGPLEATTLSTQPLPPRLPGLGWRELARWTWRQLTSMRTALFLLFLLALGAVPGSVFPQRGVNPGDVTTYLTQHPTLGPVLDRLGMFDVFGSAWFAAVYLLLFVSLLGCVVPRSLVHARAMRARPPAAPRNLSRLPEYRWYETAVAPDVVVAAAREALRSRRWRLDPQPAESGTVSAEKGYLRETGNLVFHLALIVLLLGVALGSLFGTKGSVIVVDGQGLRQHPDPLRLLHGRAAGEHRGPAAVLVRDDQVHRHVRAGRSAGRRASHVRRQPARP